VKNKKILAITTTFPRWQEDTEPPFVFDLEKRLTKDFEVFILAPHFSGAEKFEEMDGLKINRFQYFWPAKWQKLCYQGGILSNIRRSKLLIFQVPFLIIFELFAIRKIIKKEKIKLIHAHWIIPQGFTAVLYKKIFREKNLKIICTSHGSDILRVKNPIMNKIKKWVLNNIDKLTAVSNAIKNEAKKLNIKENLPIEVIPMGVDDKVFNPICSDEKIKEKYNIDGPFLLMVGRLVEEKGVRYLIEAMPEVIQRHPKTKLLIAGFGSRKKFLEREVKELNLEKNVIFIGAVPNIKLPVFYATADIFIGPSLSEGFGLVFVEALFSKTCAISSKHKGISDIVRNGKTGIQVDVKSRELFSKKIIELIEDKEKREKLARNGHDFVKNNYSWDIIAAKYSKTFLEIN